MNILLVEDTDTAAKMAELVIKMNLPDATVRVAKDGRSALECVKDDSGTQYELIFMDYGLPDMHGTEVTEKMREEGIKSTILALSGNLGTVSKDKMFAAGLNGGFSKPLTREKIEEALSICEKNKQN